MNTPFSVSYQELALPLPTLKQQALAWASRFRYVSYLENNGIDYPYSGFRNLLAVAGTAVEIDQANVFGALETELKAGNWYFGMLSYDLKNQVENLQSQHPDRVGFPLAQFFQPEILLEFTSSSLLIRTSRANPEQVLQELLAAPLPEPAPVPALQVQQRVNRETYIRNVEQIRQHIIEGDVYELNYCMEFYAEHVALKPVQVFLALNHASPTPFAGFLKLEEKFLLCASPERYLKKEKQKLISQPIKGTIRRGKTTAEDEDLKQALRQNEKEIAENLMIVDLVRNDLRKAGKTGTVQVEELFGIYGFRHVFQMISTITAELHPGYCWVDALKASFPMGSMTGAPKVSAMQLIERYEATRRGLYSGTIGYLTPEQDFDFNVVIRSLQYNAQSGYLSFEVGSAITYDSDPEQEYDECLLKAKAILHVLQCG